MAYEDRYGITVIRDEEIDKLSISIDENHEEDFNSIAAVLLYVPYTPDSEHSHIVLNKDQATVLRDWLNKFLEDKEVREKYDKDLKNR